MFALLLYFSEPPVSNGLAAARHSRYAVVSDEQFNMKKEPVKMAIGFFDSGIGGLTVLAEAMRRLPDEDYIYVADTLHVPYGSKPEEEVRHYIFKAVAELTAEGIDALVIACNTATSLAVAQLREQYAIPIIGMEPAVKPAVEMNRETGKRVLVFATPLTLKLPKYYALLSRVDEAGIVDSLPLPELVSYCEALQFDERIMTDYFQHKLASFDMQRYGIVVLGCTHYPFYRPLLRKLLPPHIEIVDGNAGTIRRLVAMLHRYGMPKAAAGKGTLRLLNTAGDPLYTEKMQVALAHARSNILTD